MKIKKNHTGFWKYGDNQVSTRFHAYKPRNFKSVTATLYSLAFMTSFGLYRLPSQTLLDKSLCR